MHLFLCWNIDGKIHTHTHTHTNTHSGFTGNLVQAPEHHVGQFATPTGHAHAPTSLLPFGVGPRVCIGQSLANMEARTALLVCILLAHVPLLYVLIISHLLLAFVKGWPEPYIYTVMTVYLVNSQPKKSYMHRIYIYIYIWFWPTLHMCSCHMCCSSMDTRNRHCLRKKDETVVVSKLWF